MKAIFRNLVAISTALFVFLWLVPFFDYHWLNEEELTILSASGYGSLIPESQLLYWFLFVAWIVISIGLWLFIDVARTAYLYLLVATSVASFFWGFNIFTPYENGIQNIVTLSDGAILVMAYFTSINNEFSNDS